MPDRLSDAEPHTSHLVHEDSHFLSHRLQFARLMRTALFVLGLGLFGLLFLGGCATTEQTEGKGETDSTAARPASDPSGPELAPQSEQIRTVQLYRGSDERNFPITSLRAEEPLTLEFDLMRQEGQPLSIYFQHADRTWSRDLSPSQFLESYHNDKLLDYRRSQGTVVPYVHYEYRFPNDDIRFRMSGNYILRVTKQGQRDEVLFERAFFVTDETGNLRMGTEAIPMPGQRQPSVRPLVRYEPPANLRGDPFGYTVCFVRNGRLPDARCQDRPLVGQQPTLAFELDRSRAFDPTTADYTVDLGNLRAGPSIENTDRSVTPFQVLLEPDYAQFSGRDLDTDLNGQIVVRAALDEYADPALRAEYVRTTFAFVPPKKQPLSGDVVLAGSFAGMDPDRGTRMQWRPGRRRYEGSVLLKQGRYQYFYSTTDPLLRHSIQQSQARRRSTYTTFVYYKDPSLRTDRLLRVTSVQQ